MEDFSTIDLEPGRGEIEHYSPWVILAATLVPFAVAAVLIPLRGELSHSAGIVLVLPVVIFGLTSGAVVGTVSAVSAAVGFDLFLVTPYLHPGIAHSEDVIATVSLLFVGVLVGLVGSRLSRINHRSNERLRELTVLAIHSESVTKGLQPDELLGATSENLVALLGLRSCRWEPKNQWDPTLTVGQPTLLDNGQIIGRLGDLPADRSHLPSTVELVVADRERTYGRFVVEPGEGRTSIEERRIAMTFCRLTASCLSSQKDLHRSSVIQENE